MCPAVARILSPGLQVVRGSPGQVDLGIAGTGSHGAGSLFLEVVRGLRLRLGPGGAAAAWVFFGEEGTLSCHILGAGSWAVGSFCRVPGGW